MKKKVVKKEVVQKVKEKKKTFKVSRQMEIEIHAKADHPEFVPNSKDFKNHKGLLEQVAISVNKNLPLLLIGETGTGKTSLIRYLASKTNNGFRRVNHNGGTTVDDIVGKILINKQGTYWVDGVLIEAMRKGLWYLADEINASSPEINFIYHSLLDDDGYVSIPENGGEIVTPHPNFRFFGAMNGLEYAGTKELNKALLSRFLVAKTDFPPPHTEAKILVERAGIDKEVAMKMVKFASSIRANHAKEQYDFVLSTRDLIMWATLFTIHNRYIVSAETTILNKVNSADFTSIKDYLAIEFKAEDEKLNPKNTSEREVQPEEVAPEEKVEEEDNIQF